MSEALWIARELVLLIGGAVTARTWLDHRQRRADRGERHDHPADQDRARFRL